MAIKKLKDMKPGESGLIVALHGSGNVKHRLIDMGLVNGTKIHVMKFAPLGDPVEIKGKNFELEISTSDPLLEVEQIGYIDDGRAFEYSISRHAHGYEFMTISMH